MPFPGKLASKIDLGTRPIASFQVGSVYVWNLERWMRVVVLLGAVLVLSVSCGHTPRLDSQWPVKPIVIDGADGDWGERRYVLEKVPITFAVANDSSYLYLFVMTNDRGLQLRVARSGVELWLDPKGGVKSYFGVRLPGVPMQDLRAMMGAAGGVGPAGGFGGSRRRGGGALTAERLVELLEGLTGPRQVLLLDAPEDDGLKITPGATDPVQARFGYQQGRLIYEARVPLRNAGHPGFVLTSEVGLALRLPAPEMPEDLVGPGAGDAFGGGGRSGGGYGGPRGDGGADEGTRIGGRGRRGSARRVEAMEQWVQVQLQTK